MTSVATHRIGAGVDDGRPFRLGFLLHLDRDVPPARAYREAVDLFVAAEALGYDSGWVIQRHFRQGNEHVSAPLVILASIAQHTNRIRLGTGVLVLPLEDPLKVAEDAATLDEISGGRLELGVGSGPFAGAWEAFGKDLTDRHRIFEGSVDRRTLSDEAWQKRCALDLTPLLREAIYLQCALGRQIGALAELALERMSELVDYPEQFKRAIELRASA